ncbi:hypothetical protein CALCODRAFT_517447 [Calocera cornea HHB12733]|uniref:Jacalin-type lectin domain-containing protein n=1 Tax=Calocera cornea HHB12733 TaxID=1353952 RepID=A0A165G1M7_9BASI|nr:hypothetical protein CALCODRAFT_517447 [Calocera cornea HHB12733]
MSTQAFGINTGSSFDDSSLGNIKSIKQIALSQGWLVDCMKVTYNMADGSTKVGNHLGSGTPNVTIDFDSSEVLIGVTGRLGMVGYYSNDPYLCSVSFIILNHATGKVREAGPYGAGGPSSSYTESPIFNIAGEIKCFSGKLLTESSDPTNALTLMFPTSQVVGA